MVREKCNDCSDVLGGTVWETDLDYHLCHTCHLDSPWPDRHAQL